MPPGPHPQDSEVADWLTSFLETLIRDYRLLGVPESGGPKPSSWNIRASHIVYTEFNLFLLKTEIIIPPIPLTTS